MESQHILRNGPQQAATTAEAMHTPVLFAEILSFFPPTPGGRYLDGTLGLGGHAAGLLAQASTSGMAIELLGLDQDAEALALAKERLAPFGQAVHTAHRPFSDCALALDALGWASIDGALIDIGVSSLQLDTPERGFSFLTDGPLDMRMDQSSGQSAASLVNRAPVDKLRQIIAEYGEDPQAGRIARAIEAARAKAQINSTAQLARIVEEAYPAKWRAKARNHPATRTFQALRMAVNNELDELSCFLESILPYLKPGGRVGVISFHSLEDRIVKHFFRDKATGCRCPSHIPVCVCGILPVIKVLTKKPVLPAEAECLANSRARSAKLRVAERLG